MRANPPIYEFKGPYRFLSNFYPAVFVWDGIVWPHSEAAYQAAKFSRDQWHEFAFMTPNQAKKEGQVRKCREDWEQVKIGFMTQIVAQKFYQNIPLMEQLIATGDALLEEGNNWKDTFWGKCPPRYGRGKNNLGKILMELRDEICNSLGHERKQGIINYAF